MSKETKQSIESIIEVLGEFNDRLNRGKPGDYIGVITGNNDHTQHISAAVMGKLNAERFLEAIEEAIKEDMDYESVSIISAESFDYGYELEIEIAYVQDGGEPTEETYYIKHTVIY